MGKVFGILLLVLGIWMASEFAQGTWYFFGPFTFRENNQAKWQATRYHEEYAKVAGEWKIKHLKIRGPGMSADYETGWAR